MPGLVDPWQGSAAWLGQQEAKDAQWERRVFQGPEPALYFPQAPNETSTGKGKLWDITQQA